MTAIYTLSDPRTPVVKATNARRRHSRARHMAGQILEIRARVTAGKRQTDVAAAAGTSHDRFSRITSRQVCKHLPI